MIEVTTRHWAWRVAGGRARANREALLEEAPVGLVLAGRTVATLMATPERERELAAGFVLTMGLCPPGTPPPEVGWDPLRREASLALPAPPPGVLAVKSAGGGPLAPAGRPLADRVAMELSDVLRLTEAMAARQPLFAATGASHAAALFDRRGRLLLAAEDVGRHNALDKAVGGLWLAGRLGEACAAGFSGRQSLEMVRKAAQAGIGILAGVSAPSAAAARAAGELGLTLIGFARQGRLNVYTHPGRLLVNGRPLADPAPGTELALETDA